MPRGKSKDNTQEAKLLAETVNIPYIITLFCRVEVAKTILFDFGYDVESVANKILNREIEYFLLRLYTSLSAYMPNTTEKDFKSFANRSNVIDSDGITRFCSQIGIEVDVFFTLIFCRM